DATGGLAYGGNWVLEASRGQIEAAAPIDAALQASYDGLLTLASATTATTTQLQPESGSTSTTGVTTSTAARQVATGASGTVVVWTQSAPSVGTEVWARFYAADGTAGAATRISGGSGVTRSGPAVAVDDAGNALFAWSEGTSIQVAYFAAPSTPGGAMTSIRSAAAIDTSTSGDPWRNDPSVAMSPDGRRAVVAWQRRASDGNPSDVDVRRLQLAPGTATPLAFEGTAPTRITDAQGLKDQDVDLAIRNDGSGVVVFASYDDDAASRIYAVRFDANGAFPAAFLRTDGTGTRLSEATAVAPTVAMDPATGTALAVWVRQSGSTRVLEAAVCNPSGTWGSVTTLVSTVSDLDRPTVAALGDGRFAVAWDGTLPAGSGRDIGLLRVSVSGTTVTSDGPFVVANDDTAGTQRAASLAAGGGRLALAWADDAAGVGSGRAALRWVEAPLAPSMGGDVAPPPSVVLQPVGSTSVTEGGAGSIATFTVALSSAPSGAFTVTIDAYRYGGVVPTGQTDSLRPGQVRIAYPTAGANALTFDATNWNTPQTITVTALDDAVADGDRTVYLQATAVSATNGSTLNSDRVAVTAVDDDTAATIRVTSTDDRAISAGEADSITLMSLAERLDEHGDPKPVTLREALIAANNEARNAGQGMGPVTTIAFGFAGDGGGTITLAAGTPLPRITAQVVIDGGLGSDGSPKVVLDGSAVRGGLDGLFLADGSAGSRISGLAVVGFGGTGIVVQSSNIVVENSWVGVFRDAGGHEVARPNGYRGIEVSDVGVSGRDIESVVIRDNLVANNGLAGIRVLGRNVEGTVIVGNRILGNGTSQDPGQPAEERAGVLITNGADDVRIGIDPATGVVNGNTIRGNGSSGVVARDSTSGHTLVGNVFEGPTQAVELRSERTPPTPILQGLESAGNGARITVSLSGAEPGGVWRIDFYRVDASTAQGTTPPPAGSSRTGGWASDAAYTLTIADDGRASAVFDLPAGFLQAGAVVATATRLAPGEGGTLVRGATSGFSAMVRPVQAFAVEESVDPTAPGPSVAGTVQAPAGVTITRWSVLDGAEAGRFSVDATGRLSFVQPPDADVPGGTAVREVVVRATDALERTYDTTVRVTVTDRNEAPVLALPAAQTLASGAVLAFDGAQRIQLSDPDTAAAFRVGRATLTVDAGRLSSSDAADGVKRALSDDGRSLSLVGEVGALAAALRTLVFTPPTGAAGATTLTVTVSDVDTPELSASGSVSIAWASNSAAPRVQAARGGSVEIGQSTVLRAAQLRATDADNDASQILYRVEGAPTLGALRLGDRVLARGDTFTQADVDAGRLSFGGPREGTASFTLSVADVYGTRADGGPVTLSFSLK
ncbi:MAG: cadherin-like domain-containing protein, partial [Burkholderiales bacterium]